MSDFGVEGEKHHLGIYEPSCKISHWRWHRHRDICPQTKTRT